VSALPSIAPAGSRPASDAQEAADLYARHSRRIFGYCLGLLRDREEAEDAVQTTFLNAYRGLQRGVRPEFEVAWLFKIAQNVCRTRRDAASRRGLVELARDPDVLQDLAAAPEHEPGWAEAFAAALKRMPERYRTVIVLREWQGLSYREIGEELGLSEAAVEMLVFRARRSLAEQLEQAGAQRTRALDLGSLLGFLKTGFGGVAVKTAVTALAVTATATAVAVTTAEHARHRGHAKPVAPLTRMPTKRLSGRLTGAAGGQARSPRAQRPTVRAEPSAKRTVAPGSSVQSPAVPGAKRTPGAAAASGSRGDQATPAPPRPAPTTPAPALSVPSESVPSVTVPSVPVPGTSVETPTLTVPGVDVPGGSLPATVPGLPDKGVQLP